MEKPRIIITESISRKPQSLSKAKTDHKKEEPLPINLRRNKNPCSVGKTDPKKKGKPVVDPAFSKVEMPSLFCFSMNLQEIAPGMTKSRKLLDHEQKLKMRDRKRLIFTKKLHKMYQLAMAHQATFSRILAKHSDDFGPDMDPLGSFKVYPDDGDETCQTSESKFNEETEYQEGRRESCTELSLNTSELLQTLDSTRDEKELNTKKLVYIQPVFPLTEEIANSSNEPHEILDKEENDSLTYDLDMLSVEDSQLGDEKLQESDSVISKELQREELNPDRNISDEGEILSGEGEILSGEGEILCDKGEILSGEGEILCDKGEILSGEGEILCDEGGILSGDERKSTDTENLVQDEMITIPHEENIFIVDNVSLSAEKKS